MEQGYIAMDVGGTNIKAAVLDYAGMPVFRKTFNAHANESASNIVTNFVSIIQQLSEISKLDVIGIGIAFPGPFDYKNGISYIQNLGKFDSLYHLPFRTLLQEDIGRVEGFRKNIPIIFGNDATHFGLGVANSEPFSQMGKILCITIGTGCGSAFIENRELSKSNQIPENGWIYNTSFKDSIIDDYLSARGLLNIVEEMELTDYRDGVALFNASEAGDTRALEVFEQFGKNVQNAIMPFIKSYQPEGVVFGGQISKSGKYFLKELQDLYRDVQIISVEDTSFYVMKGLFLELRKEIL